MSLPASDTFHQTTGSNQAIATYSASWSVLEGSFEIPSSTDLYTSKSAGYNSARWNADTFDADQYSIVTVTSVWLSGGSYMGPLCRGQSGANTSYHIDCNGSEFYFSKNVAGSQSTLAGPVSVSLAAGDKLKLEVTTSGADALLKVYKALAASPTSFSQVGSTHTDSSSPITSAGYAGIFGYNDSSTHGPGAWEGGNVGGGGGDGPAAGFRSLLGVGK